MDIIGKLQEEIRDKSTPDQDACWIWNRYVDPSGYGSFRLIDRTEDVKEFFPNNNRSILAHKASYLVFRGDIADKQVVMHRCNKRHCVNPNHLYIGTALDVAAKGIRQGQRLNKKKYCNKSDDVKNDIRARLLAGQSFTSIGKRYGMSATSISCYGAALERQRGCKLVQRRS